MISGGKFTDCNWLLFSSSVCKGESGITASQKEKKKTTHQTFLLLFVYLEKFEFSKHFLEAFGMKPITDPDSFTDYFG